MCFGRYAPEIFNGRYETVMKKRINERLAESHLSDYKLTGYYPSSFQRKVSDFQAIPPSRAKTKLHCEFQVDVTAAERHIVLEFKSAKKTVSMHVTSLSGRMALKVSLAVSLSTLSSAPLSAVFVVSSTCP